MSNIIDLRAPGFSGQHAIDTWESEGGGLVNGQSGGLASAHAGHDFGRPALAENAGWRASNHTGWWASDSRPGLPNNNGVAGRSFAFPPPQEDEQILRCLGAAVIMRWNTIPTKLQKELFDDASSMGELLQTDAPRGQIARFLHKHKGDAD